jgi:hypothetical protein
MKTGPTHVAGVCCLLPENPDSRLLSLETPPAIVEGIYSSMVEVAVASEKQGCLDGHLLEIAPPTMTYRRDRFGECWHIVPPGERGPRGRTLCGEPRQGTPLSETYAEVEPVPPDCICERCRATDG